MSGHLLPCLDRFVQRSYIPAPFLTFPDGLVVTLPADHRDRDPILREAERSLRGRQPVGVLADETGRLIEIAHAYQSAVRYVRDDEEDDRRVVVAFWGFSA